MKGCKLLLLTALLVGSSALIVGTTSVFAEQDQPTAKAEAAARKALEKRAELLKKRQNARKFVQQVIEDQAQEKAAASAVPDSAAPHQSDRGGGAK